MCDLERFYLKLRDAKEKFDFTVHRQAEAGFNLLVCDRLMHIFTKKHTIENIAVVRILNHFTFTLCTLPWIHVARTGYLSSWRKCLLRLSTKLT